MEVVVVVWGVFGNQEKEVFLILRTLRQVIANS
jgi:hypothetical protein